MAFVVIADEPAAFEAWRARQLADAGQPIAAQEEAGRQVFIDEGLRFVPRGARHVGRRHARARSHARRRAGGRSPPACSTTTRGSLAAWIADPQTLKPGNNMPMVELQAGELQAVSAYLASLR